MKIAICDDDALIRELLIMQCKCYAKIHQYSFEIMEFSTGEALLEYSDRIDMVFLDIELPGISGLEVKDQIERIDTIGSIIFTTSHHDTIYDAFGRKTIGYIVKPMDENYLFRMLDKVVKEQENHTFIEIIDENTTLTISSESILYIKSDNIYTEVTTTNKVYIVRKCLNDWENILDHAGFYRMHKSFLVNMKFIQSISNNKAVLENGEEINVGRSKIKKFREIYYNYIRSKMH